jgi:hypothetical protein
MAPESKVLEAGKWVSFVLNPLETVTLQWIGRAPARVQRCALPLKSTVNFVWAENQPPLVRMEPLPKGSPERAAIVAKLIANDPAKLSKLLFGRSAQERAKIRDEYEKAYVKKIEVPQPPKLRNEAREEAWEIVGAQLAGPWFRELRVAYPFTPQDQATAPGVGDEIFSRDVKVIKADLAEALVVRGQVPAEGIKLMNCQGVFED